MHPLSHELVASTYFLAASGKKLRSPSMRFSRCSRYAAALIWSIAVCPVAAAQSEPEAVAAKAAAAYKRGDFLDAAELYGAAYAASKAPVLLFNRGRCFEALGGAADLRRAVSFYREYLDAAPESTDKAAVLQRIATLEQQASILERPAKPPSEPELQPNAAVLPWIIAGAGSAGITVAVVLGVLAQRKHDAALLEPSAIPATELNGEAQQLATGANIALGLGAAAALAGGIWGIVDLATLKPASQAGSSRLPRLGLVVSPDFSIGVVSGRF